MINCTPLVTRISYSKNHGTASLQIKFPNVFCNDDSVAEEWKLFKQRWEVNALSSGVEKYDDKGQVAFFVNCLLDEALGVHHGFTSRPTNVSDIINEFEKFAVVEINVTYERFLFNSCTQKEGESVDQFISNLRNIARESDFWGAAHAKTGSS